MGEALLQQHAIQNIMIVFQYLVYKQISISVVILRKQNSITIVVLWKQNCISVEVLWTQNSFTEAHLTSADIIGIKPNLGLALMRWNWSDWSSHESSQYCWQQSQYVRYVWVLDALASLVSTLVIQSVSESAIASTMLWKVV